MATHTITPRRTSTASARQKRKDSQTPSKTPMTVRLTSDLHDQLKRFAVERGTTMHSLIISWVWDGLRAAVSRDPERGDSQEEDVAEIDDLEQPTTKRAMLQRRRIDDLKQPIAKHGKRRPNRYNDD